MISFDADPVVDFCIRLAFVTNWALIGPKLGLGFVDTDPVEVRVEFVTNRGLDFVDIV